MKVCIAEKPSVARDLAKVLGANQKKNGYFEGNGYQITWTFGHLCTLKEPHDYDSTLKRWDLITLPIVPQKFAIKLIENDGSKKQFKVIETLVQKATEVINCGDAGQEGELIQRWVLHQAKCKVPVKRLWISSLTEEAIKKGFNKLQEEKDFDLLYKAGSARAIGDWLLGINATRLYTIKFGGYKQLLSIGRVQTPTLALITDRFLEIQNFKKEKYWELKTKYRNVIFSYTKGRFTEQERVDKALAYVKGKPFVITSTQRKEGTEAPPYLFDLTSLQVECNKKFNFSAEQTLKIAQSLYEKKLLTYPRVDTSYLPNNMYGEIGPTMRALVKFQNETTPLLSKPFRKTKKVFNDQKVTDHHAIIPTKIRAGNMNQNEAAVYDLVALRFIAAFYPDCKVAKTEVRGNVEKVEFKASGKEILDLGWRIIYKKEEEEEKKKKKKKGEEEEQSLPNFTEGESGEHQPEIQMKETKPPKLYTEATLLRAMETAGKSVDDDELRKAMKENGIGRPSTRANIIETLFRRKYIERQRKNLIPTQAGLDLIGTIQNDLLKSAELTGIWEKKLRQIEDGTYQVENFMHEIKTMVGEVVLNVKQLRTNFKIQTPTESLKIKKAVTNKNTATSKKELTCPKCKRKEVIKGKSAYGCTGYKDKSCDFVIKFEFEGKKLTEKQIESLIIKGRTPEIKGFKINKTSKNGVLTLNDQYKLQFNEVQEAPLICPKCSKGQIIEGKTAFGCENWKNGCDFKVPFINFGKKITKSQLKQLTSKGITSKIKGFQLENDKNSEGRLKLNPDFSISIINN
ncbi:type IA DNA topoisomerase [Flammeovirga pacifica]|uniref:DNA topoisomerase n=1 Tax=Flammeovirga pacifica TaxID=915059 RepID=A0A1S1Z4B7_FLAPC|nr:type IA DNA topoisomerase [Flammeovirga pacifica]OHX68003.1 DNA topoisomerase III [Flammeovirga pacifica]